MRRQLYRKVISGFMGCQLHRDLFREKFAVWNEVVENVNVDFDGNKSFGLL